jgi:hypothetical protein
MLNSIHGKIVPLDLFLKLSVEDMFLAAYVDGSIMKFKFFELILVVLFSKNSRNLLKRSNGIAVPVQKVVILTYKALGT